MYFAIWALIIGALLTTMASLPEPRQIDSRARSFSCVVSGCSWTVISRLYMEWRPSA